MGSACAGPMWWVGSVTDVSLVTLDSHAVDVSGTFVFHQSCLEQITYHLPLRINLIQLNSKLMK